MHHQISTCIFDLGSSNYQLKLYKSIHHTTNSMHYQGVIFVLAAACFFKIYYQYIFIELHQPNMLNHTIKTSIILFWSLHDLTSLIRLSSMHFIPLIPILFSPHHGRPTFQVCVFKFAIFLLLNILELYPPFYPVFCPSFQFSSFHNSWSKVSRPCIYSFLLPFGFKALRIGGERHGS